MAALTAFAANILFLKRRVPDEDEYPHEVEPETGADRKALFGNPRLILTGLLASLLASLLHNFIDSDWTMLNERLAAHYGIDGVRGEQMRRVALRPEDHAQHPVGRVGRPEDVAAMVAFLVGGESGFVTGAEFVVDGGMTRKMIYVE